MSPDRTGLLQPEDDRHLLVVESNRVNASGIEDLVRGGRRVSFITCPRGMQNYGGLSEEIKGGLCRYRLANDTDDVEELARLMGEIDEGQPVDGVAPGAHFAVLSTTQAARMAGMRCTSADAAALADRKDAARLRLGEAGIPSAEHAMVEHFEDLEAVVESFGFPVVVKPVVGGSSTLVSVLRDAGDLDRARREMSARALRVPDYEPGRGKPYIVEEFLSGRVATVEIGVCADGTIVPFALTEGRRSERDPAHPLGSQIPACFSAAEQEGAWAYAERLIRAFGFDLGVAHIELTLTSTGWRMIEFNPRLMGGAMPTLYGHAKGESVWADWMSIYCGDVIGRPERPTLRPVASRVIATFVGGTVDPELPRDWMAELAPDLLSFRFAAEPGDTVAPIELAADGLGYIQFSADSAAQLSAKGDRLLRWIERRIGVELAF